MSTGRQTGDRGGHTVLSETVLRARASWNDVEYGRRRTVVAGEAFAESVGDVHRGFTGDEAADVIATYTGVPAMPVSVSQE